VLRKSITYEDFAGGTITEDFYFNLSKAELVELELSHKGGLSESIKKIMEAEDGGAIIREFKNIILKAYGKRSDDGRRFMKSQEMREEFESTEAYSVLFIELVTDAEKAAEFVNGIIPQGLVEDESQQKLNLALAPTPDSRKLTSAEIVDMDADDLKSGLASGRYTL
jgi:hypothetical protein